MPCWRSLLGVVQGMDDPRTPSTAASFEPSRTNIRLLGRVLGDVIRAEDGQGTFDQIEGLRQASVRVHKEAAGAGATMAEQVGQLSLRDAVRFAHSFACFLQLNNIAEDQIQRAQGAGADQTPNSLKSAIQALAQEGTGLDRVLALIDSALMAPVITAHPSEVRRKSILDRQQAISGILDGLDRAQNQTERARLEHELARQVTLFWRTRQLRGVRLGIDDEINNAVSYFERSFLPELPKLYAHWLEVLGEPDRLPSFLRVGSWVGGDRDGNPNVTEAVVRQAMTAQSRAVLSAYLDAIHGLGAELSISSTLAAVSPALKSLADATPDRSVQRADEPYRLALSTIYARLAAT
jgi:phosphoenolpyruvate carboxylase